MALENKLGLNNDVELAREEERLSKIRATELYDKELFEQLAPGSVAALRFIHGYLFQDIYAFAGKIRDVNTSKGSFRFVPVMYLEAALTAIENMPMETFDEIIEKYVEMNVAHPFREGNGRATRIWLDVMLKHQIGCVVDWSRVDKEDYLLAMERSPIRDKEIKSLLKDALTTDVDNRTVYMKGIDASYAYEGYSTYTAEELGEG